MPVAIEARKLTKAYDGKKVVDGIHLQINEGECFGLIGPNGAGKSTTLRMMYCSSPPTSGELFVLGLNVRMNSKKIKSLIGVVPQDNGLDPDFSVMENLLVYARYFGIPAKKALPKARELLRFMHLEEYDDRPVDQLSGGMQRRLVIARALMSDPQLVFLDEPTTGLDPQARYWIWEALRELKDRGRTLVLTSHYMEEVERICDRVALIDKGQVLALGSPQDLIRDEIGHEVVEFVVNSGDVDYYVRKIKGKFSYQILNNRIRMFIGQGQDGREALSVISSESIWVRKSSLDDVFLKLAGYELRQ